VTEKTALPIVPTTQFVQSSTSRRLSPHPFQKDFLYCRALVRSFRRLVHRSSGFFTIPSTCSRRYSPRGGLGSLDLPNYQLRMVPSILSPCLPRSLKIPQHYLPIPSTRSSYCCPGGLGSLDLPSYQIRLIPQKLSPLCLLPSSLEIHRCQLASLPLGREQPQTPSAAS
jgi:hypothetical protein